MEVKRFLLFVFVLNLVQGICTPIINDEAYYWMWSLRLDTGYFDHPPMIALWVKMSDLLFDAEIGARFFTILFNTVTAFLFWKLLNPISKKEKILFTLTYYSLIFVQLFSFIATPDAPLLFFTILYLLGLKNFLINSSFKWTFLLGIAFAGLMYSKYHGILVLIFTLLPIYKYWIKKPSFYFATIFSLVLYAPHLFWLYENDFPPISYHFVDRSAEEKLDTIRPIIYILTAAGCSLGLLSIFLVKPLITFKNKDGFEKSIFWLAVGPFIFFLFASLKDSVQAQWLSISYIACGILFYWYYTKQENISIIYKVGIVNITVFFIARIIMMIPGISPLYETKEFGQNLKGIEENVVAFEKYQEASVYQFYNRNHRGIVYRTLGNRNSQFSIWDDEAILNQPFAFVSPWLLSEDSIVGFNKKTYYINHISGYKPIHHSKAAFNSFNNQIILNNEIVMSKNDTNELTIKIASIDLNLLKNNRYSLSIFITKDAQYNIVKELNIPLNNIQNTDDMKGIYTFKYDLQLDLQPGDYIAFIGISIPNFSAKYQSEPLKLHLTE